MRSFVDDNRDALAELGMEVDQYSTHTYRPRTATLAERAAGLTLASRLLGHADEQITRGIAAIDERAECEGKSRSEVIREALHLSAA